MSRSANNSASGASSPVEQLQSNPSATAAAQDMASSSASESEQDYGDVFHESLQEEPVHYGASSMIDYLNLLSVSSEGSSVPNPALATQLEEAARSKESVLAWERWQTIHEEIAAITEEMEKLENSAVASSRYSSLIERLHKLLQEKEREKAYLLPLMRRSKAVDGVRDAHLSPDARGGYHLPSTPGESQGEEFFSQLEARRAISPRTQGALSASSAAAEFSIEEEESEPTAPEEESIELSPEEEEQVLQLNAMAAELEAIEAELEAELGAITEHHGAQEASVAASELEIELETEAATEPETPYPPTEEGYSPSSTPYPQDSRSSSIRPPSASR